MAKSSGIPNNPIHTSPHGFGQGSAPQAGLSRDGGGSFVGSAPHMSKGGNSPHGDAMVAKYKPGSKPPMQSSKGQSGSQNPALSKPYDSDGDDWL